jgi:exodeoxyribonuclease VII small subunit
VPPPNSPPSKPRSAAPSAPNTDERSFEDALQDLESIITRIESGEVGLEKSLAEYERGVELIRRLRSILKNAEQRVEELSGRMLTPPPAGSEAPAADEESNT